MKALSLSERGNYDHTTFEVQHSSTERIAQDDGMLPGVGLIMGSIPSDGLWNSRFYSLRNLIIFSVRDRDQQSKKGLCKSVKGMERIAQHPTLRNQQ